jgi:hypothetical protein
LDKQGFLTQCSEEEALAALGRILVRSPYGKWSGSRHFGLRDFFEDARRKPECLEKARDELNAALSELGIACRVESIEREPGPNEDTMALVVNFSLQGDRVFSARV